MGQHYDDLMDENAEHRRITPKQVRPQPVRPQPVRPQPVRPQPAPPVQKPDNYKDLLDVLLEALSQASSGKGNERHADGKAFSEQPMQHINGMVGVGFSCGQAIKKIQEQMRFPESQVERKVTELLGAINYIAGTIITLRKENSV